MSDDVCVHCMRTAIEHGRHHQFSSALDANWNTFPDQSLRVRREYPHECLLCGSQVTGHVCPVRPGSKP